MTPVGTSAARAALDEDDLLTLPFQANGNGAHPDALRDGVERMPELLGGDPERLGLVKTPGLPDVPGRCAAGPGLGLGLVEGAGAGAG